MASGGLDGLEIRRATHDDDPQVLDLMRETHGWRPDEPNEQLFRWKHRENPFGESPAWVALSGDRVVGFRTFLRWEFLNEGNHLVTAVRAVDTATAEDHRGRGIFRALTLQAVGALTIEGVGIVFNTPNDQSRPGYLKMGWTGLGHIPIGLLPSGPQGLRRMTGSRVPAERWSIQTDVGIDAIGAFTDATASRALLEYSPGEGFRTRRTLEYLTWRTSLAPLHYRLVPVDPSDPSRGGIVFRLRKRGEATEAVVVETFVRNGRDLIRTTRSLLRAAGADYALAVRRGVAAIFPPLPRQGPALTARAVAMSPPSGRWMMTMADVELM